MSSSKKHLIYQFKITLLEIEPSIWRRIQVPADYSFWDLHVAIQDAMGWLDYHLHAFFIRPKHKKKAIEIGIPSDDWDGDSVVPGWEVPITDHFIEPGQLTEYRYDFGDRWIHEVLFGLFRHSSALYRKFFPESRQFSSPLVYFGECR